LIGHHVILAQIAKAVQLNRAGERVGTRQKVAPSGG